MGRSRAALTAVALAALVLLGGSVSPASAGTSVTLPPAGGRWDYQLGGNRPVPDSVEIVDRDRQAKPKQGAYNVCYVNGFQTQVVEKHFWRRHHWDLVLKDHGQAVTDSVWGEWLVDLRTPAKRRALAAIVGRWTDGCARHGFDAVEYDNLDSFSRSHHLLTKADNKAYARLLVARAHADGLAAGQKNWAEWNGTKAGFDFAIAEQCGQYHECRSYTRHYGRHVLAVEYAARAFAWTCRHFGSQISVVRRDVDLRPHGLRRWC